ncbi:hypothetical protein [Rhodanobacter sp. A1T4]|uniref:hypothetical protein n=1 Tax=Rhodanobacter sp. A1T4 TaxID=2723087 RepID=UPI0016206C4F|nr:hypothetical protein [Rhodanobacter sp. A1T4]MBB6247359.1 hypothetical protein [Rhodanobacter sp. A1T4]
MDDLFQNPEDSIEVEPADLGSEFIAALTSSLAKKFARQEKKPWGSEQESELQEKISTLVAAANKHNLKSIRIIVTRPDGKKDSRELDVERINKTRSLQ